MHSANILHRDLKPRNLLVNSEDCKLKICDFGLSRPMIQESSGREMTDYVVTRYYRAPELLLEQTNYTTAVDVWSLGCILAEILTRKPLMQASSSKAQLELICQTIDLPEMSEMKNISEETKNMLSKTAKKKTRVKKLTQQMKDSAPEALDLLQKMLKFDPK